MNPIETVWLAHLPHHRNCSCWADGFGSVEKGLGEDRRSYPKIQVAMTTSCSPSPQEAQTGDSQDNLATLTYWSL